LVGFAKQSIGRGKAKEKANEELSKNQYSNCCFRSDEWHILRRCGCGGVGNGRA
jgi:hypothetical protein